MKTKSCGLWMILVTAALALPATSQTWQLTSGTGSYQDAANWNPATVPGAGSTVLFTVPGASTVTFSGGVTNASATIGAAASAVDLTVSPAGNTWALNSLAFAGDATMRFDDGKLEVAQDVLTQGRMVLNGGITRFAGTLGNTTPLFANPYEVHGGDHRSAGLNFYPGPSSGNSLAMRMTGGVFDATKAPSGNSLVVASSTVSLEGGTLYHTGNIRTYSGDYDAVINVYTNAAMIGTAGVTFSVSQKGGKYSEVNILGGTVSNTCNLYLGNTTLSTSLSATGVVNLVEGVLYTKILYAAPQNNAVGIFRQSGGVATFTGTMNFGGSGAQTKTLAELHLSGGTLNTLSSWNIGMNADGVGRFIKTGGHLQASPCGLFVVGDKSSGTTPGVNASEMRIDGGTLYVNALSGGIFIGKTLGGYGYVGISGGTNVFIGSLRIGHDGGTGFMRITGGETSMDTVTLGGTAASTGRLELSGGVLAVKDNITGSATGVMASTLLMDGGVLRHVGTAAQLSLISSAIKQVSLTDRGAVVEPTEHTVTIPAALVDEPGCQGTFTKRGAPLVTLSSANNAFTGRIGVEAGELKVTGGVYLTGGMVVDSGALLNLSSATVKDSRMAVGTTNRIDGTVTVRSGGVLTNAADAVVSGNGTLNGGLVVEAGGLFGRDKLSSTGPLTVSGAVNFESGSGVVLTGYALTELSEPLALLTAAGGILLDGPMSVGLNGRPQPLLHVELSADAQTLTVRYLPVTTVLIVR